jgi:alpha-amylase
MAGPTAANDIDLTPKPNKVYADIAREWREEFIYFLMLDRFHDSQARAPVSQPARSDGFATASTFYGGTLAGVKDHLDYIAGLGCTAIWISPPYVNNADAYHGYDIYNYLDIDPHFGTKQDLVDLVDAAHARKPPMRVILDVVINHSGDNWSYPGGFSYDYSQDQQFDFGGWRRAPPDDPVVPTELDQPRLYHRRGQIHGYAYDSYPENQHGDIFGLKDYANDDDQNGSDLINILIKAHAYWIREADVDGFRVDAVKHMGELACSRFCSNIREYALSLGKRSFFLFGELATPDDDAINRYIGQNTSQTDGGKTVFFGLDSVLDFRLAEGNSGNAPLRDVIKAFADPATLFARLEAQRNRALNRGEIGRYLVTFLDNHDGFWQPGGRFGRNAPDDQIIGGVAYLLCSLGTPCIYYGTEQGFQGSPGDLGLRGAMFDKAAGGGSLLNTNCRIYKEIAKVAAQVRANAPLRFGRMYFREISGDGRSFGLPFGTTYTLAFSRLLYGAEVLFAYNVDAAPRNDCVVVDADLHPNASTMRVLYRSGGGSTAPINVATAPNGTRNVQLALAGREVIILG